VNGFKGNYVHYAILGFLILSIISGIRFNIGYQNIYVDLPVVVLFIINFSLITHLMLKNKMAVISVDQAFKNKLLFLLLLLAGIILILFLQGYVLNIYDTSLYTYHMNVFINVALLAVMFYCLSFMNFNATTFFMIISVYALANSLLGVMQYIFNKSFLPFSAQDTIDYYEGVTITKRVFGFVGASNGAGNLGAILFSVLLYYHLKRRSYVSLFILLSNVIFVVLTFTRIGYMSIIAQLLVYILFSKMQDYNHWIKRILVGICSVFAVLIAYRLFYHDIYQVLVVSRGNTESHRFTQFNTAFELFKEHIWFGIGAGQYIPFMQSNFGVNDIALHSQFMNIMVEQGLISVLFFIVIYISLFVWSLKIYKEERWLPISLAIGNLIVVNFNPNQYYSICIYTFFILIYGLVFLKRTDGYTDMLFTRGRNVELK
jgi:O-antigen ligase